MVMGFTRRARLRTALLVACVCVAALGSAENVGWQAGQGQQSGEVQTGPITEPRSAEQKPNGPPVAKGMQAITRQNSKCSTKLIVNADALFGSGRWNLNPDAGQTMDALASLIAKGGKHPVRIEAFTSSADSERDNQSVAERRAITVRGWLLNHGFIPQNTPIEGFGKPSAVAPNAEADGAASSLQPHNERVEVVIDTCK